MPTEEKNKNRELYRPEKRGGFAYIYKVKQKDKNKNWKEYGIKCVKSPDHINLMRNELKKLGKFAHTSIMYPKKILTGEHPLLLMEWAQFGVMNVDRFLGWRLS